MESSSLIDSTPLWALLCISAVFVLLSWETRFRIGIHFAHRHNQVREKAISTTVAAILGLLGFLLGFNFNMASSNFLERRKVLITEVNAIGTTFLRSRLIAEPERSQIRDLLREYADLRMGAESQDEVDPGRDRTSQIQYQLWGQTVSATEKSPDAITAQFVIAMNQLIDVDTTRTTMIYQHRIPSTIWASLIGFTMLGIGALGYQNGLDQSTRSPTLLVVALTFALVAAMIADLDTPGKGALQVDQQAMINLRNLMNNAP